MGMNFKPLVPAICTVLFAVGTFVCADGTEPAGATGKNAKTTVAGAAETTKTAMPDVKKMSGKDLYKNHCKVCHAKDSEFDEYTPMTLIQEQWETFFDEEFEDTHKTVSDSTFYGGKNVVDVITDEMLKKMRKFCVDHAADSEHPMTCG